MFVALDATYLVDPHPSGIAIYSRELLDGLARSHPGDQFLHLYRLKQYRRSGASEFPNVRKRLMLPPLPVAAPWIEPDVFHALNQRIDQRAARRVVATFHDLFVMTGEYSSADFRKRFTQQARNAAKRADMIIAVSQFTKDQIVAYLNVSADRIRVVPHGVHLPPAILPLEQREKMILCVGALQIRKNVVRLVEAFERLPTKVAAGWKLVLAGSTAGFGANEIVARIERSLRVMQIQLRGYVSLPELKDLYQRASIFAFPSLDEGFGIPVLEAMANGLPVVTSNRSALPDVAGEAALLADPYDADSISQQLRTLMEEPSVGARLSDLGMQRARQFPWSNAVNATYAIYSEIR